MFRSIFCLLCFSVASWASAQTGSIRGTVTDENGETVPGVVVVAASNVLPQDRTSVTNSTGKYRLPLLPPGEYELTVTFTGFQTQKVKAYVGLDVTTQINVVITPSVSEDMTVTAQVPMIDPTSAELTFNADQEIFEKIPLGQDYRDLLRLAPGVQVTEMNVRGPSAGGNGQDNVYQFDGVDVTLPLFGTLAAEPSSHDVDQFTITKGGAKATNFNRSGGLLINSISKSGTSEYQGEVEFVYQDSGWSADTDRPTTTLDGETTRSWASINYGGPLVPDRLYFFTSYYAPRREVSNISNVYGQHPDVEADKDELFAKLTFSPATNLTLHGSFRTSDEEVDTTPGALTDLGLTGNSTSTLDLTVLEGDWIMNENHGFNFNFTRMKLDTDSVPDNPASFTPSREIGSTIDLNNLHNLGTIFLPNYGISPERDALYQPFIDRYGYFNIEGTREGGGVVGLSTTFDNNDFARTAFEINWNGFFTTNGALHEVHVGFRRTEEEEDLSRSQTGLGAISFLSTADELIRAEYLQESGSDPIHSEYHSSNFEINDTITAGKWTFNAGLLLSNDELFGQDLAVDPTTPSGFRNEVGSKYKMYELDWADMVQPRFGILRQLRQGETVYANWAVYKPMASSLPRAASWARNRRNLRIRNYYNSEGVLVRTENRGSSSGKFFMPDMDPREIQEYLVGYNLQTSGGWAFKLSARHRYAENFWEDTENNARIWFYVTAPEEDQDAILARGPYIPDLDLYRFGEEGQDNGVGGSSYVIAQLDGAFTRYYEVTADAEKRGENYYLKGSYTWSHYYGNFDQDNASSNNDLNVFIGSSFLADGVGRQIWDFKYGNLKGDRRHMLKLYGSYDFNFGGTLGALAFYQSGEPWETSDVEFYREYTGSSSNTNRFSEPAGSRTGSAHTQLDLNYNHAFQFSSISLSVYLDILNVFDKQTDFNIDSVASSVNYGVGRDYFEPRRYQFGARLDF